MFVPVAEAGRLFNTGDGRAIGAEAQRTGARRRHTLAPPGPDWDSSASDDNPDATRVVRPRPSGRRAPQAAAPEPPAPPPQRPGGSDATLSSLPGGGDSLLPFAMPLLQLLAQLRTLRQADPAPLRDRTAAALQSFEARAEKAGHTPDQVRRAHYALCDSLDEAVLNTPWGNTPVWQRSGMVASFHPAIGPGRFFDALRQVQNRAAEMRPVLELMVVCLSLGVMGRFREQPNGASEVGALRAEASRALLADAPAPGPLSAQWQGVDAPFRRRRARLPLWVGAVLVLALGGGAFLLLGQRTNEAGDAMFARMLAAPPAQMPKLSRDAALPPPPAPPAPAEPGVQDRLRARLGALAASGAVVLAGTPATPVLRLPEAALFPAGSATPGAQAEPLLGAVAEALRPEGGRLRVLGYADDRPVRTVLFPSAFKLTAARAEAVRAVLGKALGPAVPVSAEGRGAADPLAANATAEGRAQNRRVEVVLDGAAP